jgi:hypothetical protein
MRHKWLPNQHHPGHAGSLPAETHVHRTHLFPKTQAFRGPNAWHVAWHEEILRKFAQENAGPQPSSLAQAYPHPAVFARDTSKMASA